LKFRDAFYRAGKTQKIPVCTSACVKTDQATDQAAGQVSDKYRTSVGQADRLVKEQVADYTAARVDHALRCLIIVINGEMKRSAIQAAMQLKHRETFTTKYLKPALDAGYSFR